MARQQVRIALLGQTPLDAPIPGPEPSIPPMEAGGPGRGRFRSASLGGMRIRVELVPSADLRVGSATDVHPGVLFGVIQLLSLAYRVLF